MLAPLPQDGLNHRDDRCRWDCCGESWNMEYCSSVVAKQTNARNSVLSEHEKARALEMLHIRANEAEQHDRLNPPPVYPTDDGGIPEDINGTARRLEQAVVDADDVKSAKEAEAVPLRSDEGASFFSSLASTLNLFPLMESLGERTFDAIDATAVALSSLGNASKDNIILPMIAPVFGFDRFELDKNIGGLTDEIDRSRRLRRSAELYVEMLGMNGASDVDVIEGWLDAAVKAWLNVVGKQCPVIQLPYTTAENDLLANLIAELDPSFSSGLASHSSRMSLAASLSPSRHLSEAVFFDWYVMCRFNEVRFALPEFSGFPVLVEGTHTSFTSCCLRKQSAIYALLKDRNTVSGFTFDKVIQPAVDSPGTRVGCVAGDQESYTVFREMYVAVALEAGIAAPRLDTEGRGIRIDFWAHGDRHDMSTKLIGCNSLDSSYVKAIQFESCRNLQGFPLSSHVNRAERIAVEKLLKGVFAKLQAKTGVFSSGSYQAHSSQTAISALELTVPGSGLLRDWPYGRGRFLLPPAQQKVNLEVVVNEADHVNVCATLDSITDLNVEKLFETWKTALIEIEEELHQQSGFLYMRDPVFGFLATDPTNVGTGLHVRAILRLPFLSQPKYDVPSLSSRLGLEAVRLCFDGTSGDGEEVNMLYASGRRLSQFATTNDSWLIRGIYRLGCSEVEQIQALIDGLVKLTALEKCLVMPDLPVYQAILDELPLEYHMPAVTHGLVAPDFDTRKFRGKVHVDFSDDVPLFTQRHLSATARVLQQNPALYYALIPKTNAAGGWSASTGTQSAVDCLENCPVGIYLKGEQAYQAFEKLLVPIITMLHDVIPPEGGQRRPFDALRDVHRTNLKLYSVGGLGALDPKYLCSFHVEVSRNIRGIATAAAISRKLRRTVEYLLYSALTTIDEKEIAGKYHSLRDLEASCDTGLVKSLQARGLMPARPKHSDPRSVGGLTRDWPDARGVFASTDGIMHMHVNVDDHLKVVYTCDGMGDSIGKVMHRLSTNLIALEDALLTSGLTFMHSERLGYLTGTPALLGTAMRITAVLHLPQLTRFSPQEVEIVCSRFGLNFSNEINVVGRNASVAGTRDSDDWLVESCRCLGQTEVQQIQQVIDACLLLIRAEKDLEERNLILDPVISGPSHRNLIDDIKAYIESNQSGCTGGITVSASRTSYPPLSLLLSMRESGLQKIDTLSQHLSSVFIGDAAALLNDGMGVADKVLWIDPFTRTLHW